MIFSWRDRGVDNIILIGMPGAGKSTVGVLLAKALGKTFLDTDLLLQEQEGMLLQDLVDRLGVESFLDREADALCALDCRHTVIAPGGSAVCRERSMARLKELGRVASLHLPLEALERRLQNIHTRGIAMAPGETLADLFACRAPLYRRYADLTVDVGDQTLEETVAAALQALDGSQGPSRLTL